MVSAGDLPPTLAPQHVVMCAFPFGSHVPPLHALARALAAAAPEATFTFVSTAETLVSLPEIANVRLVPFEAGIPDAGSSNGVVERVGRFLAEAQEKIRAAVKAAMGNGGGAPVTCVLTDAFMWMAESVAEEMGIPWVAVFTGFSLSLLAHVHADDLRIRFGIEEEAMQAHAEELIEFIPALARMRVRDLPEGIVCGGIDSDFSRHIGGMVRCLPKAAAVALVTFAGIEQDSTIFAELNHPLLIGPPNLLSPPPSGPDKEDCLPWLDSRATCSVAYVAFGSIFTPPPSELAELAHGLEDSGVPFLWSLKLEVRPGLPEGFVERTRARGKLVNWAPQLSVLSHAAVGVFVTHCGWSSVLESISAGVAMLCRPFFGDQKMAARALEEMWGVGLRFDGAVTRNALVAAMDAVFKGEDGKRMRERVLVLRERTHQAMLPGGSLSENFEDLVKLVCRK